MMLRSLRFASLSLLVVSLSAVAATSHHSASKQPSLTWRGDVTTARGMVTDVAHAWTRSGHGAVVVEPFNTASGIDAVLDGNADVGGSARDASRFKAREKALTFTPVAWDALVMVTNHHNPAQNITLKQLHDIYYGKITNWQQLGGKNQPIHLYSVVSPGDGVEFSLRRLLFGRGNQPVAAPRLYVNVSKLEEAVTLDPQGLGVSTLSGAHADKKLKMLSIDGVKPSPANVADGSYPLYTPLYLTSNPADPKAAEVKQFIDYFGSPKAQSILRQHLLLPYADGTGLASMADARDARVANEVGRMAHNGPTAAPGATYAAGVANAPTSERTLQARQRLAARRQREAQEKAMQQKAATPAQASTYTVKSGDTLWGIAHDHHVSVTDLRHWNHLKSDTLKAGQTLKLQAN
ncbi:substrate-binding domain-containing protein [Oleiagrimonas sp. C23AA]|uniref:LysM peptidoglycan-binding domain-containing protein n=1 Tax=Oleiagrimonas sp. C23AA TaxID=2719047 RepID=UPI00142221FB|nr:substrate-binding domain-containing protein [Oleiagrimonas sp. C23AA]NII09668.1 LysM peptidoglycan-binding domain-containing protein [Oleiagrimonas sp. C23AA]